MTTITTGVVTPDLGSIDATARVPVGTMVSTTDGGTAMYVQATSTIAQYNFCIVINTSSATGASIGCVPVTTTNVATSQRLGVAQVAITSSYYGWLSLSGNNLRGMCAVSCQPAVPLFTTATAGVLDDAVVTAGYCLGVVAMTSAASASAPPIIMGPAVVRTWGG